MPALQFSQAVSPARVKIAGDPPILHRAQQRADTGARHEAERQGIGAAQWKLRPRPLRRLPQNQRHVTHRTIGQSQQNPVTK